MGTPSTDSNDSSNQSKSAPDHSECLKILNNVLDEEASDEERNYFKQHLQNCMPYYEIYNVDKKIKQLIKQNCNDKKVPKDLVDSIREKILHQAD